MENDRDSILNELLKYYDAEPETEETKPTRTDGDMEHTRVITKTASDAPQEEQLGNTVAVGVKKKPAAPMPSEADEPEEQASPVSGHTRVITSPETRPSPKPEPVKEEILGNMDLAGHIIDRKLPEQRQEIREKTPEYTPPVYTPVTPPRQEKAFVSTYDDSPDDNNRTDKKRSGIWFATKPLWVLLFFSALLIGAFKFYITDTGIIGAYKRNFNYNMGLICDMLGIEWNYGGALPVVGKSGEDHRLLAGEDSRIVTSSGYAEKDNVHDDNPQTHYPTGKDRSLIPFADAGSSDFSAFANGVVCVSSDKIRYINKNGNTEWSHDISVTKPMVSARGKYIAVASEGGTRLRLYKNDRQLYETDVPDNIRFCAVSEKGDTVLITDKPSYKGAVILVNNKGETVFSWVSGTNHITAATVLKNRKIGVALSNSDNSVTSYVMMFDIKSTEPVSGIELQNSLIYSLANDGKTIMANGDNAVALITASSDIKYDNRYDDAYITHSANDRHGYRLITYTKDNLPLMEVLDKNGGTVNQRIIEGTPDHIAINMTTVLYNNGRDVICGKAADDRKTVYTAPKTIKKLLILDTDSYVIVYGDSIEIIRM